MSTSNLSNPPEVILEAPLSILPKPEVIDPESNAPVVTRLDIAVISLAKYVAKV